jgi:hypothetical protein
LPLPPEAETEAVPSDAPKQETSVFDMVSVGHAAYEFEKNPPNKKTTEKIIFFKIEIILSHYC